MDNITLQFKRRFAQSVEYLDGLGHGYINPVWTRTWIGQLICSQTEYYITGDEEFRRF